MLITSLSLHNSMLAVLFLSTGLAVGSFGNVLIARLPLLMSILGRSHCPHCSRTLRPLELIPILSFLWLQGRCATCHRAISYRYPLVELLSAIFWVFALWHTNFAVLPGALLAVCLWLLLIISVIDIETKLIPDVLNISVIVIAVLYALSTGTFAVWSLLAAGGFFGVQWILSGGRWVGSGDILLAIAVGAMVGDIRETLIAIAIAYMVGALYALYLITTQHNARVMKSHIAFGPFLAIGGVLTLLFGEYILTRFFLL